MFFWGRHHFCIITLHKFATYFSALPRLNANSAINFHFLPQSFLSIKSLWGKKNHQILSWKTMTVLKKRLNLKRLSSYFNPNVCDNFLFNSSNLNVKLMSNLNLSSLPLPWPIKTSSYRRNVSLNIYENFRQTFFWQKLKQQKRVNEKKRVNKNRKPNLAFVLSLERYFRWISNLYLFVSEKKIFYIMQVDYLYTC